MQTLFTIESPHQLLNLTRRRFALSLFYVHLVCAQTLLSQRSHTSFGLLCDYQLEVRPKGFALGFSQSGVPQLAVLAVEQPAIQLFDIGSAPRFTRSATITTQTTFRFITATDMNRDGEADFIALAEDGRSVSILLLQRRGTWSETRFPLAAEAERCVVADLNNDRRNDILLFGKSSAGVATLLGTAQGKWKDGPVLFPEISVSDLEVVDLNRDGVADIILLNWLSNQLMVFYGISRLVYTEQVAVQLETEPGDLALTQPGPERTFLVAVTCPDEKRIHVYSGNALGDYRLFNTLDIGGTPSGVQFANPNGDADEDVLTSSSRGLHVALGTPAGFTRPVEYGAARTIVSWSVADMDGDQKDDCILVDESTQRAILLLNEEAESRIATHLMGEQVVEYGVGASPQGMVVADFNGDGRLDVGVVNAESSSLSFLLNRGWGRLSGQIALPISSAPRHVSFVPSARGVNTLITSHPSEDIVTVVSLAEPLHQSSSFSVPTGDQPYVAFATEDTARLKFIVRYRSPRSHSLAVSLFEHIGEERFVEHSLRTRLATPIVALSIQQAALLGSYEFVYATQNSSAHQTTVWHTVSQSGMQFPAAKELFSFTDSKEDVRYLLHDYVNEDGEKDVIAVLGPPTNSIAIWYAGSGTSSPGLIEWIRNVQPLSEDAVLIRDVNGDDFTDIIWIDGLRKAVVVLYGTERGGERQGHRRLVDVAPARGAVGLRVAALREVGVHDLILSHPERGSVSVIWNPFRK